LKFLILTQYFLPETGAPPNRLFQLAKRLQQKGAEVTILTAMPNYPQMRIYDGYRGKFYTHEIIGGLSVHRSWIYTGTSKAILFRLINYFSFVKTSFLIGALKLRKQDFILCESPPLFLGISAYLLAKMKGARLIFNVSDLWPESAEKLGLVTNRMLLRLSTKLEEFLYRHSLMVTGQTQGIVRDISARFPRKTVFWLKNGADMNDFVSVPETNDWRAAEGFQYDDFLLLYAGIMGHAQGLEVILHAARLLHDRVEIKFILMGSGPVKDKLMRMKKEMKLDNVFFLDNRPKSEVIPVIREVNAAIVPLRKIELFKGAIPSKIFENLALRKPVLLGVEGEAKELIIGQGQAGLAFIPEDANDLAAKILMLADHPELAREFGNSGYDYLCREFDLDIIADGFWKLLNTNQDAKTNP